MNPAGLPETNDLIYEGIATSLRILLFVNRLYRNKRPDLRRDCDFSGNRSCFTCSRFETNDLIYEGIATIWGIHPLTTASETNDLIYEGIAT